MDNKGHVNVWGDEWITCDDVWTGAHGADMRAYWNNVLTWLGQGSLPVLGHDPNSPRGSIRKPIQRFKTSISRSPSAVQVIVKVSPSML